MGKDKLTFKLRHLIVSILLFTFGTILNRLVMWLNNGMPAMPLLRPFEDRVPITEKTRLTILADVIPIFNIGYCSIGDLLIIVGTLINTAIIIYIICSYFKNGNRKLNLEW